MHTTNGRAVAHTEDAARHGLFAVQVHKVRQYVASSETWAAMVVHVMLCMIWTLSFI